MYLYILYICVDNYVYILSRNGPRWLRDHAAAGLLSLHDRLHHLAQRQYPRLVGASANRLRVVPHGGKQKRSALRSAVVV